MKKTLPLFFILLLSLSGLRTGYSQYNPDRHNTSYNDGWISCEPKDSPNSVRGPSHWIMYDLGGLYKLGKIHLWNTNVPDFEVIGIKDFVIDYSSEGNVWKSWGEASASPVSSSGYYTGEEGPDLGGIEARFLLITALTNHGGDCVGFSEIRIQTEGLSTDVFNVNVLEGKITAQPSIFEYSTSIIIEDLEPDDYSYTLTDLSGRVILQKKVNIGVNREQIQLDGTNLVQGVYIFSITDGIKLKSIKIEKIEP